MFGVAFFGEPVAGGFSPFSTEYTTPGTDTITIPEGALTCTIECYGAGASADGTQSGGGGAYSQKTAMSVVGLTALYLSVPVQPAVSTGGGNAFVRENSSSGTIVCLAKGGGSGGLRIGGPGNGTGDIRYSGGNGVLDLAVGGGGAAGPTGNGSNGSSPDGGTGNGGVAGNGGDGLGTNGMNYGGGGGNRDEEEFGLGAQGYIKLTWA